MKVGLIAAGNKLTFKLALSIMQGCEDESGRYCSWR